MRLGSTTTPVSQISSPFLYNTLSDEPAGIRLRGRRRRPGTSRREGPRFKFSGHATYGPPLPLKPGGAFGHVFGTLRPVFSAIRLFNVYLPR